MCWYTDQTQFLKCRFGDDWQLVAGLLAATSPRVRLRISWDWTLSIYDAVKVGRKPDLSMLMKSQRKNVERILKGEPLSGHKVSRFYANLCGDLEPVTIDTWMLKLWKVELRSHNTQAKQYGRMERAFQKWARLKGVAPATMQAILWNHTRSKAGKKPTSFAIVEETNLPF